MVSGKSIFCIFVVAFGILFSGTLVLADCDYYINQENLTSTYTITHNHSYYCLNTSATNINYMAIHFPSGTENVTLDCGNFNLDGNETSGTYGIYLNHTKNSTVKNCNITDFVHGILLYNGENSTIRNNTANSNSGVGIYLYNYSSFNVIKNNTLKDNLNRGIAIYNTSSYNNVTENFINNSDSDGITLGIGSYDNLIKNNTIHESGWYGITISRAYSNLITENNLSDNSNCIGIYYPETHSNNFTDNTIEYCTNEGIYIYQGSNNTFSGGSVRQNQYDFYITTAGSKNSFRNTNFTGSRKIFLGETSDSFNYNNDTTDGIWLNSSLDTSTKTVTRKLISWAQNLVKWNDSTASGVKAYYNLSGLSDGTEYEIFDNGASVFNLTATNGEINFSVDLSSEHEIKVDGDTSPKYWDNSTNSTMAGKPVEFRLRWTDNAELSGYIFSIHNGSFSDWWNSSWIYRKNITITESDNVNRTKRPVEVNLTGLKLDTNKCTKEIRIADENGNETPSQIIDDNGQSLSYGSQWCVVTFLADVSANSNASYKVYYGNGDATVPDYSGSTDLSISESTGTLTAQTDHYYLRLLQNGTYSDEWYDKTSGEDIMRVTNNQWGTPRHLYTNVGGENDTEPYVNNYITGTYSCDLTEGPVKTVYNCSITDYEVAGMKVNNTKTFIFWANQSYFEYKNELWCNETPCNGTLLTAHLDWPSSCNDYRVYNGTHDSSSMIDVPNDPSEGLVCHWIHCREQYACQWVSSRYSEDLHWMRVYHEWDSEDQRIGYSKHTHTKWTSSTNKVEARAAWWVEYRGSQPSLTDWQNEVDPEFNEYTKNLTITLGDSQADGWINDTWNNTGWDSDEEWSNVTKVIRDEVGTMVKWKVYANDTSGNENVSEIYSFTTTTDTTSPKYWDNSTNSTLAGKPVEFRLRWTDSIGLSSYIFSLDNCTGSFVNVTNGTLSGTEDWSNETFIINNIVTCKIRWRVYANDTSDNWNVSDTYSFITIGFFELTGKVLLWENATPVSGATVAVKVYDGPQFLGQGYNTTDSSGNYLVKIAVSLEKSRRYLANITVAKGSYHSYLKHYFRL